MGACIPVGPACHVARSLHRAARDRRRARPHRSGVGRARVAGVLRGAQALPARSRGRRGVAVPRRGRHLARPLRSPRSPHDPRACQGRRPHRHLPRCRCAAGELGRSRLAHHGARLVGELRDQEGRGAVDHRCAFAALLGPYRCCTQFDAVVVVRVARAASLGLLQRRHGAHPRVRGDRITPRSVRSGDARGRRVSPRMGRHPPRSGERAFGACSTRRGRAPARALGHVQPRDTCLGRASGDAREAFGTSRRAPRHATAR